jgi:glutaredoxin
MKHVSLTVLTSPGCAACHDFLVFWEKERELWPSVDIQEHSLLTPAGQEIVQRYQAFASPAIILNDELLDSGGFNKEHFLKKLTALSN